MQLSFTQLTIDYYPYHKAGMYNNFFKYVNLALLLYGQFVSFGLFFIILF